MWFILENKEENDVKTKKDSVLGITEVTIQY